MKKRICIPNQRRYLPQKHRPATPKPQVREERVRVGDLPNVDMQWAARRINLANLLADIQQVLAMEVEEHLRERTGDPTLDLADMRHHLDRIKEHAGKLVSFVDGNASEEYALRFGEVADHVKEYLYQQFGIENN